MNEKISFITELLNSKKIDATQKEKLFLLTANELKKNSNSDEKILAEIEIIKKKLANINIETDFDSEFQGIDMSGKRKFDVNKNTSKINMSTINLQKKEVLNYEDKKIQYRDGKGLYQFLYDYNQDEILSTTCHLVDSDELENINNLCGINKYDFSKHRELVQKRFIELINNKKYFIDYKFKNLVYAYITGKLHSGVDSKWTTIEMNWNSEELYKWHKENPNLVPYPDSGLKNAQKNKGFKLTKPETVDLTGVTYLNYFSEVVLHFKNLFHIRGDNSLLKIIKDINMSQQFWENKIEFIIDDSEFPDNIELFTNVEKLIQAYKILINLIIEVVQKNNLDHPTVNLKLKETDIGVEFSIIHTNTQYKKTITNTLERDGATQTKLIRNQINGMCDFYIKADFGNNQYAKINIWNGKNRGSIAIEEFNGVEYLLIFKK